MGFWDCQSGQRGGRGFAQLAPSQGLGAHTWAGAADADLSAPIPPAPHLRPAPRQDALSDVSGLFVHCLLLRGSRQPVLLVATLPVPGTGRAPTICWTNTRVGADRPQHLPGQESEHR